MVGVIITPTFPPTTPMPIPPIDPPQKRGRGGGVHPLVRRGETTRSDGALIHFHSEGIFYSQLKNTEELE